MLLGVPGFPVWDLAGLIGSTGWGLWVAALGVTLLLRPVGSPSRLGAEDTRATFPDIPTTTSPPTADLRS